jgi:predicted XRE-type DNA-binding protein
MRKTKNHIEHEVGSGNVFADLGVRDPEQALAKAKLARALCVLIEKEGLSQSAAARRLGIDQPKVSALVRGRLADFSLDRLMRLLLNFGHDVKISVTAEKATVSPPTMQIAVV